MRPYGTKNTFPKPRSSFMDNVQYGDKTINEDIIKRVYLALNDNNLAEIKKTMLEQNTSFYLTSEETGESPMHIVIKSDNLDADSKFELVNFLIENGSPITTYDKNNVTPLHLACKHQLYDVVRILLKNGANVNDVDNQNMSCLHYLCQGNVGNCTNTRVKIFPDLGGIKKPKKIKKNLMMTIQKIIGEMKKTDTFLLHMKNTFDFRNLYDMYKVEFDETLDASKLNMQNMMETLVKTDINSVTLKQNINHLLTQTSDTITKFIYDKLDKTLTKIDIRPDNKLGSGINNVVTRDAPRRKIFPFNDVKDILKLIIDNKTHSVQSFNDSFKIKLGDFNLLMDDYFKKIRKINESLYHINKLSKIYYFLTKYDDIKDFEGTGNPRFWKKDDDSKFIEFLEKENFINPNNIVVEDIQVDDVNIDSPNLNKINIDNEYHNQNYKTHDLPSVYDDDPNKPRVDIYNDYLLDESGHIINDSTGHAYLQCYDIIAGILTPIPYSDRCAARYGKFINNKDETVNVNIKNVYLNTADREKINKSEYVDNKPEIKKSDYVKNDFSWPDIVLIKKRDQRRATDPEKARPLRHTIEYHDSHFINDLDFGKIKDDRVITDKTSYFIDKTLFIVAEMHNQLKELNIISMFNINVGVHHDLYIDVIVKIYIKLLNIALWISRQHKEMDNVKKHISELVVSVNNYVSGKDKDQNIDYLEMINDNVRSMQGIVNNISLHKLYSNVNDMITQLNDFINILNKISAVTYIENYNANVNQKTAYFQRRIHSLKQLPNIEEFTETDRTLEVLKKYMFETFIPQVTNNTYTFTHLNGEPSPQKPKIGFLFDLINTHPGIDANNLILKNNKSYDDTKLDNPDTKEGLVGRYDSEDIIKENSPPTTIYNMIDEHFNYLKTRYILEKSLHFINNEDINNEDIRNVFKNNEYEMFTDDAFIDSMVAQFIDEIIINNMKDYISINIKKLVNDIMLTSKLSDDVMGEIQIVHDNNEFKFSMIKSIDTFYENNGKIFVDISLVEKDMEKPQIDEAKINGSNNTCISIDLRLIDLLMKREYKCDVNKRDIIGANPIYYCIMNENMDAVKKLINYGSFVKSIKTRNNISPYGLLIRRVSKTHNKISLIKKNKKNIGNNIIHKLLKPSYTKFKMMLSENPDYGNNVLRSTYDILPLFMTLINYNFLKRTINKYPNKNNLFKVADINPDVQFSLDVLINNVSNSKYDNTNMSVLNEMDIFLSLTNNYNKSPANIMFNKNLDIKKYQRKWKYFMDLNKMSPMYIHLLFSHKVGIILTEESSDEKTTTLKIISDWYDKILKEFCRDYDELKSYDTIDDDYTTELRNGPLIETRDILTCSLKYTVFTSLYYTIVKILRHYIFDLNMKMSTVGTIDDNEIKQIAKKVNKDVDKILFSSDGQSKIMKYIINDIPLKCVKNLTNIYDSPDDLDKELASIDEIFEPILGMITQNSVYNIDESSLIIQNLNKLIFPYFKNYIKFFVEEAMDVAEKYYVSIISEANNLKLLLECEKREN